MRSRRAGSRAAKALVSGSTSEARPVAAAPLSKSRRSREGEEGLLSLMKENLRNTASDVTRSSLLFVAEEWKQLADVGIGRPAAVLANLERFGVFDALAFFLAIPLDQGR